MKSNVNEENFNESMNTIFVEYGVNRFYFEHYNENLSDDEIDDLVVEEIKKRFSLNKVEKRWYQWYLGRWGREMCYVDLETKRGFKAEFKFDYDSKLDDDEDFDLEDLIEKKIKERYDEELKKSLYSYSFGYHFY